MYKLFIFVAVFSAAAKLRRLALCIYLWIQRRKFQYACSHERPISPKHVRVEGASLSRGVPFFQSCMKRSRIDPQKRIRVTCHTPTQTWRYWRKCCVTYLLVEWWHFIIINTKMTFATETRPWWPNTLISGSAVTSSDDNASFTTTSLDSWRYLWS